MVAIMAPSAMRPVRRKTAGPRLAMTIRISGRAENPSTPFFTLTTLPSTVAGVPAHMPRMMAMASAMAATGRSRWMPMAGKPEPPAPMPTVTRPEEMSSTVAHGGGGEGGMDAVRVGNRGADADAPRCGRR